MTVATMLLIASEDHPSSMTAVRLLIETGQIPEKGITRNHSARHRMKFKPRR